jgi:phosphoglycerol transferase MdoB-like AlkP superfamily enzyme
MNRPTVQPIDSYFTKIVKYIPTEIVAGYVALSGFILGGIDSQQEQYIYLWVVFIVLLILTPLYLHIATSESGKKPSLRHPVAGVLAFAVWAFASGGPFMQFQWYDRTMGSIILVLVCLCLPLIERALPSKSENAHVGDGHKTGIIPQ